MLGKIKIFVSAYACEPNLGSEIGVGWHWVLEMSRYFDLWVLTRKSNQSSIEEWIDENPEYQKINFIYFDLPYYLRFWKKGMRGVRTYYNIWQLASNSIVKKTMQDNEIKVFHHLTYGNALWPVSNYGKNQFFIWGPTGVGDVIPEDFSKHYTKKGRLIEWLRRASVRTLPFNSGFLKRCKKANLILCKTDSAFASIPSVYRHKAKVFTDVAVEKEITISHSIPVEPGKDKLIKYFAAGRLDAWRGFDLLIEAFAEAQKLNPFIRLEIVGKGADKKRLESLIMKHQLDSVITLGGQVSMEEYYQKIQNCDVVVNPCLKEGAVTTAFDSMTFGKPLICIETGGYTKYFSNDYSVIIPLTDRQNVIQDLANGIIDLTDKGIRELKGSKSKKKSTEYTWERKGEQIYDTITQVYETYI